MLFTAAKRLLAAPPSPGSRKATSEHALAYTAAAKPQVALEVPYVPSFFACAPALALQLFTGACTTGRHTTMLRWRSTFGAARVGLSRRLLLRRQWGSSLAAMQQLQGSGQQYRNSNRSTGGARVPWWMLAGAAGATLIGGGLRSEQDTPQSHYRK